MKPQYVNALGLLALICVSSVTAADPKTVLNELEKYRQRWNVPGVAIVAVSDFGDNVLIMDGLGVRNANRDPVTAQTPFQMGSTSKAVNAFAISRLAEKGILNMTRPIIEYRPTFRLNDSVATRDANFVDLLSHRTGLPRADLAIAMFNNSGDFFDHHIQFLAPSYKFREGGDYQNHMHALAGLVASDVYECHRSNIPDFGSRTNDFKRWYAMMKAELFDPLNMTRTTGDLGLWMEDDLRSDSATFAIDYATGIPKPEVSWYDPMVSVPYSWIAPAGSISTNAEDLVKYLRFLLKKGVNGNGTQVLSKDAFENSFALHNPYYSYGLGWVIDPYRGKESFWHNGATTMSSGVRIFPEVGFGVFVLTNNGADWGAPALNFIVDRLLFGDNSTSPFELAEQTVVVSEKANAAAISQAYASLPNPVPPPTVNATAFLGTYDNGVWGVMDISASNVTVPIPSSTTVKPLKIKFQKFASRYFAEKLGLTAPTVIGELIVTHYSGNTFLFVDGALIGLFAFVTDGSKLTGVRVSAPVIMGTPFFMKTG